MAAEPPPVADLRARSAELVEKLMAAASHEPDTYVELVGLGALVECLRRTAPSARRTALVLQPHYFYDPEDPGVALVRASRARGIRTRLLTLPTTPRTHPLLSSILPDTLLGPVFLRGMVVDDQCVVVGGPDTAEGERRSWWTADRGTIAAVTDVWESTEPLCRPILPPGEPPPMSERQLDVCRLLAIGEKDKSIARSLEISSRTVERDVATILSVLDASSRTEAVLLMRGRGVNGGLV